jgi:nucleotide-binding universal stress UspA family protein
MATSAPVIVVGYDGSAPAADALEFAIAHLGDGVLCIVHAWEPSGVMRGSEVYPVLAAASLAQAEALVDELPQRHPGLAAVRWSARVVEGTPVHAIEAVARELGAAEIVVGTHGHGRLRAAMGSTAHALLHAAPCPVTVVPGRAEAPLSFER